MRNIGKIINTDAHHIFSSVTTLVVLMGLCVVPCLYAWFNIFSNWDPYGQSATSRIRVAVANEDRGADLLGVELKIGEQVLEGLKANDQIGWVFCDTTDDALERVYSGDCYAALIVPTTFSEDIVSFMTLKFEHPKLQYYENGKKNAIAPKITGKAKTAVQEQVNTTFLQTFANGAAEVVSALSANGVDAEATLQGISEKLIDLSMKMEDADTMLDSITGIASAASYLMVASSKLTSSMSDTLYLTADASDIIGSDVVGMADDATDTLVTVGDAISSINDSIGGFLENVMEMVGDPASFKQLVDSSAEELITQIDTTRNALQEAEDTLTDIGMDVPESLTSLKDQLSSLSNSLADVTIYADATDYEALQNAVYRVSQTLDSINTNFGNASYALGVRLVEMMDRIANAAGSVSILLEAFGDGMSNVTLELSHLAWSMGNVQTKISDAKNELNNARQKMLDLAEFLDALAQSQFLQEAIEVLSSGGDLLDSHLASPLKVSDTVLYPAEPYGAQMSPFYTVLALYVGALFCAVLLKVDVPEKDRPEKMRVIQRYIARYVLFICCALLQATITVAGVVLYVGVECAHPWAYFLAALVTSFCFVTINYVLLFTLGSAGLGASVIIMVVQVAGSGGTYPVEVLPDVFKFLYPYMPFKFAMNAMREAVSGFYGSYYEDNLRTLLLIALGCLIVGLIIYYPAKLLNDTLEKSKHATGVMI